MNSKEFKYLIRSISLRFAMSLRDKSHNLKTYHWNNKEVFYRTSTSDMALIYEILLKSRHKAEYYFPLLSSNFDQILNKKINQDLHWMHG